MITPQTHDQRAAAASLAHPHGRPAILSAGVDAAQAEGALVLVHGRGGSAQDILGLAPMLPIDGWALRAPQALGQTWYPYSFLAPTERNEPGLSSGLRRLDEVADELRSEGIDDSRIVWLGFSQGACLALEYATRRARRWGGVVAFSGGLIGDALPDSRDGDFGGTPIFMGCSDVDHHIPAERFNASAEQLQAMGAEVNARLYPGMGHTIIQDELDAATALIQAVSA